MSDCHSALFDLSSVYVPAGLLVVVAGLVRDAMRVRVRGHTTDRTHLVASRPRSRAHAG
jgi:hypothetical protein